MSENIDLHRIERKAWTSYFEDGLWDLFFALLMLTAAIRTLTDNVWFTMGMFVAVLMFIIGKRFITIPRIGSAKFGPSRRLKQQKMFIVILVSVLATPALLLIPRSESLSIIPTSPLMAVWLAVVLGLVAYYLDFRRLYAYGVFFAISEVLWGQFGAMIGALSQLISGTAILIVGLTVLVRFLRKYPKPSGDELDD